MMFVEVITLQAEKLNRSIKETDLVPVFGIRFPPASFQLSCTVEKLENPSRF